MICTLTWDVAEAVSSKSGSHEELFGSRVSASLRKWRMLMLGAEEPGRRINESLNRQISKI